MADAKQMLTKHGGKAAVAVAALALGWAVWSFFTQGATSGSLVKSVEAQVGKAQNLINLNRADGREHYKMPLAAQFQVPWTPYTEAPGLDLQEPDWAFYHPPKIALRFVKDKGEAQFLATPANVKATVQPGVITVDWTWEKTPEKKLDVASFRIYRKVGGGDWEMIKDMEASSSRSYEDKAVKRNLKYTYAVTALTSGAAEQSETEMVASMSSQITALADVNIELTSVSSIGGIITASFEVTVHRDGKVYKGKASNVKAEESVIVEKLQQTEDKTDIIKEKLDTQYQLIALTRNAAGQDCAVVKDLVTGEKLEKIKQ